MKSYPVVNSLFMFYFLLFIYMFIFIFIFFYSLFSNERAGFLTHVIFFFFFFKYISVQFNDFLCIMIVCCVIVSDIQ